MKLTVRKSPYSSTVGGGLSLVDEAGRQRFMVMFIGTTEGITKEEDAALSEQIAVLTEKHGVDVPARGLHSGRPEADLSECSITRDEAAVAVIGLAMAAGSMGSPGLERDAEVLIGKLQRVAPVGVIAKRLAAESGA